MDNSERIRRIQLKESLESECKSTVEQKINRYLEIEHQKIIGGHYFSKASSECIYLYRDGYFIGTVTMSHTINEGIIKFIAERNSISRQKENGDTKTIEELINVFKERKIISNECAEASIKIWKSFRDDIHHMNPTVIEIPFKKLALQNIKDLAIIEKEIFGFDVDNGAIVPHQPKHWNINKNGMIETFLRLE
jgi:hypothetical protein